MVLSAVVVASLASCVLSKDAPQERKVVFVNFDHDRARAAFRRFEAECRALAVQERYSARLQFVGVDITDRAVLGEAIDAAVRAGAAVLVAPNSIVVNEARVRAPQMPIVFATHEDPVDLEWTQSLIDRPSNLAGISLHLALEPKMLELLRQTAPQARRIGYVVEKDQRLSARIVGFLERSAADHGLRWTIVRVAGIETLAHDLAAAGPVDAWFVTKMVIVEEHPREFIGTLNATVRPAIYPSAREVEAGGTISYEAVFDNPLAAMARQLDRVLSGVRPSDIPIERPARFRLTVNVASARRAGMTLPPQFLARADQVR